MLIGVAAYVAKLAAGGFLLAVFETSIAKMRVFRVPEFMGVALMLGLLATLFCSSRGASRCTVSPTTSLICSRVRSFW